MREGDVFITNDPWKGSGHIHDVTTVTPIFRQGKLVYSQPTITESRATVRGQLSHLHPTIRRLVKHEYPVGLEERLHDLRTESILKARQRR